MRITVVGGGYVGLTTGVCFAIGPLWCSHAYKDHIGKIKPFP